MPPPLVAQYRSSWKATFFGSVFGHQDVVDRLVAEDRLELDVVVVHHQRLAGLPRPRAELVQVLRVRDPLGLSGVDRREYRRRPRAEVLDAERLVVGQDLVEVGRVLRRPDVDMACRRLEAVLVEQRAVLLCGQAAQRERLDVAVAHLAEALEHRPVRSIVAASVPKPMYSANVHSWIEILLVGTPLPAHSGAAALAVPATLALRQTAIAAARSQRTTRPRPSSSDIDSPIPRWSPARRLRHPPRAAPGDFPQARIDLCPTRDKSQQTREIPPRPERASDVNTR